MAKQNGPVLEDRPVPRRWSEMRFYGVWPFTLIKAVVSAFVTEPAIVPLALNK